MRILARNKVNVITISEEAYFSWNTAPKLTDEIDQLFKDNGVTLSGTGYQDVYWGYLPCLLSGMC